MNLSHYFCMAVHAFLGISKKTSSIYDFFLSTFLRMRFLAIMAMRKREMEMAM